MTKTNNNTYDMDDEACGSWELVMDEFKSPTKTGRGAQSTPPFAPQKAPAKPSNRERLVKRLNLDYIEDVDSDSDSDNDDSSSDYEEEKPYYNPLPNSFKIQDMNKGDPSSDDEEEDELDDEQDDEQDDDPSSDYEEEDDDDELDDDPSSDYEEEEDELDDELDDDREPDDDPSSDYEDEGEDVENDDKLYRKYTDKSDWDNLELLLS